MEEYRIVIKYFDGGISRITYDTFNYDNPWRTSQVTFLDKLENIDTLQIKDLSLSKKVSKGYHCSWNPVFRVKWEPSKNQYIFHRGFEDLLYDDLCEYYNTLCNKTSLLESEEKSKMILEALL